MSKDKRPPDISNAFRNIDYERELDRIKRSMPTAGGGGGVGTVGPPGPPGPTGPQGATGPAGATGATGVAGPKGNTGDTGPVGATGATGAAGTPGAPGVIQVYQQTGTPATTQTGALWIDSDDIVGTIPPAYQIRVRTATGWQDLIYPGPSGPRGVPGGTSFSQQIGNGSSNAFTVTHNLGTLDVSVTVYRTANPRDEITAEVEHTDANNVVIRTLTVPAANEYTVSVAAAGDITTVGGAGDLTYVHTQGTPSTTWNIPHNLDKFPSVTVVDTGGSVILPDVRHVDVDNVTLTFGSATTGKAYCN